MLPKSCFWLACAGVDREVLKDRTLNELLELAHGPDEAVLAEFQREARNSRAFVTPKVCI
jgi:hypothetical protein